MAGRKNSILIIFFCYSFFAYGHDVTPQNIAVAAPQESTVCSVGSRLDSIMQSPISTATMSKKECAQLAAYIQASDYRCRQRFRMGLNEFNHAMWLGYDDFVHKVFDDLNLSDAAIQELWQIYLKSSWCKSSRKVKKYEKIIQSLIVQRNKERLEKQTKIAQSSTSTPAQLTLPEAELPSSSKQIYAIKLSRDLESIQKEYENIPLFYDENISIECRQRLDLREQAIDQSKEELYEQYEKVYSISAVTDGYLRSQDLNPALYQKLCGTALQHVLHGEICEIFEQAADISSNLSYQSSMLGQATLFADVANSANRSELMPLACATCDFSHGLVGFVLGVGKKMNHLFLVAGKQAVISTAHALNPVEISHGLQTILTCLSDSFHCDETSQEEIKYFEQMLCDQQFLKSKIDLRCEQVSCGMQCLSNSLESWYQQRTMAQKSQDIVSGLTDIGINIVVPDLIISKVATALGLMATNIKAVKEVEKASLFFQEEMSLSAVLESGVFLEKEVEAIAQFKAGESLIAAKQEESFFQQMPWIVDEVRSPDGKTIEKMRACKNQNSRVTDPVLIEKAKIMAKKHFVIPEETLKKVQEFAQANKSFEMEFLGKLEKFEIDWEHILLPMAKEDMHFNRVTKALELERFKVIGWHHGLWQEFEKQGLIRVVEKIEKNGCVSLDFIWGYGKRAETKTFYPEAWNYDKINQKIQEALRSVRDLGDKNTNLHISTIGQTEEGIDFAVCLLRNTEQDPWRLTTAFISKNFFKI